MGHGNRETAQTRLEPQSYGKWRGSSVRKRRRGWPHSGAGAAGVRAWNRIKTSPAERVAAQHPPQSESGSPKHSVVDDSGHGIFRAGGLKAACARNPADGVKQRRDPAADRLQACPSCFSPAFSTMAKILDTSLCKPANSTVRTVRRGCSTTSTSRVSKARFSRTASRMRRLMRLRSTALPRTRPAVRPNTRTDGRSRGPLGEEIGHGARKVFAAPLVHALIISVLAQPSVVLR